MPLISQAPQLARIFVQPFARTGIQAVDMRDVLDLPNGLLQPGPIQTVPVQVSANIGEIALRRVEMTAIASRPTFPMLDMTQVLLRSLDDAMGARPVTFLSSSWIPSGEKQTGQCEIR
jgi:hypothetical protein